MKIAITKISDKVKAQVARQTARVGEEAAQGQKQITLKFGRDSLPLIRNWTKGQAALITFKTKDGDVTFRTRDVNEGGVCVWKSKQGEEEQEVFDALYEKALEKPFLFEIAKVELVDDVGGGEELELFEL